MRRVALVLVLACAGCDVVLGLKRNADETEDLACETPILDDTFDLGPPCAPWGGLTEGNAGVETRSGDIVVSPDANATGGGGCTYAGTTTFAGAGVTLEVARVLASNSGYVVFHAFPRIDEHVHASIVVAAGSLRVHAGDASPLVTFPYDADAHRWWRIRPDRSRTSVIVEVGPDDIDYVVLATIPGVVPDQIKANFIAGTSPESAPGTAAFGRLRICAAPLP